MSDKILFLLSPAAICLSFLVLGELIHHLKRLRDGLKEGKFKRLLDQLRDLKFSF